MTYASTTTYRLILSLLGSQKANRIDKNGIGLSTAINLRCYGRIILKEKKTKVSEVIMIETFDE